MILNSFNYLKIIKFVLGCEYWDRPPGLAPDAPQGSQNAMIEGHISKFETGEMIVGAVVTLITGPNAQRGPIRSDENGCFRFTDLSEGSLTLIVNRTGFRCRQLQVQTLAGETTTIDVELSPEGEPCRSYSRRRSGSTNRRRSGICHRRLRSATHSVAFINRESRFLQTHPKPAREVLLSLLEKYRPTGVYEISDPRIFRFPPFFDMGQAHIVARRFGSLQKLQANLVEIQSRIYD